MNRYVLWGDIPGYPGYKASSDGRILSYRKKTPRILKAKCLDGSWKLKLHRDKVEHRHSVGHLILLTFVGPPPKEMVCCHGERGRDCHELSNLSWGTQLKNLGADKRRDGTLPQGKKNSQSKLTDQDILNIRAKYASGNYTQRQLAIEYNIQQPEISRIIARKRWAHI